MTTRSAPRSLRAVTTALSTSAALTLPALLGIAAPATAADPATRVIELTNAVRAKAGCAPVTRDARIDRAAQGYAERMASSGRFSHTDSSGRRFGDRLRAYAERGGA